MDGDYTIKLPSFDKRKKSTQNPTYHLVVYFLFIRQRWGVYYNFSSNKSSSILYFKKEKLDLIIQWESNSLLIAFSCGYSRLRLNKYVASYFGKKIKGRPKETCLVQQCRAKNFGSLRSNRLFACDCPSIMTLAEKGI